MNSEIRLGFGENPALSIGESAQSFSCASFAFSNRVPTLENFAAQMRSLFYPKGCEACDTEEAHKNADKLMADTLRKLGYSEGVTVFEKAPKWYS